MTVGDDIKDEPFFEQGVAVTKAPQNVSALIGKTAFLTCVVRNLGKAKSVSELFLNKQLIGLDGKLPSVTSTVQVPRKNF